MTVEAWLPWVGTWLGIVTGGLLVLTGYLFGEKRGWWW